MAKKNQYKAKPGPANFIVSVGKLLNDIAAIGFTPTLVGGMALVTLGSNRVTKDFDFLIAEEARQQENFIRILYEHGFELAATVDKNDNITATIDNKIVAAARLKIDQPKSAYFYNPTLGLRIDWLFDFPLTALEVRAKSSTRKIQSFVFSIASKQHLIQLKEIALNNRNFAGDQQDLEFLKSLKG